MKTVLLTSLDSPTARDRVTVKTVLLTSLDSKSPAVLFGLHYTLAGVYLLTTNSIDCLLRIISFRFLLEEVTDELRSEGNSVALAYLILDASNLNNS